MFTNPLTFLWSEIFDSLQNDDVQQSTVIGLPCLRVYDHIIAALDSENASVIVKLPVHRVNYLVAEGWGHYFTTPSLTHQQWIRVNHIEPALWKELVQEATRNASISLA
ncbi:MAG: hypothetical protein O7C75_13050 [Verrucomicrobia bacterium]|nr:hypothetical protein [Verrucomicrobiota bacterium]